MIIDSNCKHKYDLVSVRYTNIGRPYLEFYRCIKCGVQIEKEIRSVT